MLYHYLDDTARANPDRTAVIQGGGTVTYGELGLCVSQLSGFLVRKGIKGGERVGIILDNSPEYIASYLGAHKAGGIAVAMNPQYSPFEFSKVFSDCLPRFLIVEKKHLRSVMEAAADTDSIEVVLVTDSDDIEKLLSLIGKKIEVPRHIEYFVMKDATGMYNADTAWPEIDRKSVASIIYTSGTTGEPKGVMLSHENLLTNAASIIEYLNLTREDRVMVVLPFHYSYGTSLLTTHIMAGGSFVLENNFMYPNLVLDKILEDDVTGFSGVPSTFAILLNKSNIRNYTFTKLRYITQAGGPMSPIHAKEISQILPKTDVYIMYGQTEATARLTYLDPQEFSKKPWSIGKAIPGVEIELIKKDGTPAGLGEKGEIVARGRNVMLGYWNKPGETEKVLKGGRLYTGDLAVCDEEGCYKIISRRSDVIKSGAHRISPKEIEEVIHELPEVHEVAVVGKDDEILGAVIKAVIVLNHGAELESKKVQKHCHHKLAPFKVPKEVVFSDELPKTSSGKVMKHLLNGSGQDDGN